MFEIFNLKTIFIYLFLFFLIYFFIDNIFSFFKNKNIIKNYEKTNSLTIEYFNKREILNDNLNQIYNMCFNGKNNSNNFIDDFNNMNECLFNEEFAKTKGGIFKK